jgi:hypothetical protein
MLNLVGLADVAETAVVAQTTALAQPTVARSRMGASLGRTHMPVPRGHVKELAGPAWASARSAAQAFVRPQGRAKAALFGNGAQVAAAAKLAAQQPISKVNYAHTTRIASLKGGGALGPHPARDPV